MNYQKGSLNFYEEECQVCFFDRFFVEFAFAIGIAEAKFLHETWMLVFCKYIGKLMLSLPGEKAEATLGKIYTEKDFWEFKPCIE